MEEPITKQCGKCIYEEVRVSDYRYSMHVPGGFMGCELKRTSLHDSDGKHKFPHGCDKFDLIDILRMVND